MSVYSHETGTNACSEKAKKSSKACFILKIVSVKPIKSKKNGIIGREAH